MNPFAPDDKVRKPKRSQGGVFERIGYIAEEAGKFEKREIRRDDLVPGALSSSTSVTGLVATGNIYPGEQLIADKFGSVGDTETLVIPDDMLANVVTTLSDAGAIRPGQYVVHTSGRHGLTR